ncbi:MAG: hypothetical protein NVS9B14_08380 [Candidatus Acidiferrum sp.]
MKANGFREIATATAKKDPRLGGVAPELASFLECSIFKELQGQRASRVRLHPYYNILVKLT